MFSKLIIAATALLASSAIVDANMAPSYPSPGTVWKAGQQYEILWGDDGQSPNMATGWKNFKIDFMTGDNIQQVFITNVASNLDATKATKFAWTAPEVAPYSAVYFFKFTNTAGDSAWTTRFGITGADGQLVAPEHATQPGGEKIPWGVGALANGGGAASNTTSSTSTISAASASSTVVTSPSSTPSTDSTPKDGKDNANPSTNNKDSTTSANNSSAKPSNDAGSLARPLAGMAIALVAAGLLF
ncbi:hypothetical protein BJ944DRAFT_269236 [Cunninghamella echinulata]|nr:hypothetical protein BJ944DRAFT_269236 [Cunninghamella echinulata]